jgi:hypothetical protein
MAYVGSTLYPKRGSNSRYGEKTSENGFYSPDPKQAYGGTNRDGTTWSSTYFKWNEMPAPQATPQAAPAPPPTAQGSSSVDFTKQLAAIKAQNQASMDALTKQLSDQKTDYEAREAASNKKISGLASTVANAQSQYDPMKGMGSSNNINPALTIQEKDKSLSSGTQRYNRNKLSINNLNV